MRIGTDSVSTPANPLNFKGVDEHILNRIILESESFLAAQNAAALAADQRAMSFAGLMVQAALAVGAGATALFLQPNPDTALARSALATAVALTVSAGVAAYSAKPVRFHFVGGRPSAWVEDCASGRPLLDCLSDLPQILHDRIVDNDKVMRRNGTLLTWAMGIAIAAAAYAVVSFGFRVGL